MSYELQAFIGRQEIFSELNGRPMKFVPLTQGMALVPLTPALGDWLKKHAEGEPRLHPGFEYLSGSVYRLGVELSQRGAVAYVEAFFFGNDGGQDAIVWEQGRVVMAPVHSYMTQAVSPGPGLKSDWKVLGPGCYPINEALHRLGVRKHGQYDEFDALGLGRHRKTERWLA